MAIVLALWGCEQKAAQPQPAPAVANSTMPAFFPAEGLLLQGSPDLVLAEGDHGILLTLAEYNARAFDEKLQADLDTVEARQRYLGMLMDVKVAAVEARLRGYVPKDSQSVSDHERELAQRILQQSILAASNIPDAKALAYVRANLAEFPGVDSTRIEASGKLMHAKYKMQDRALREQLESWKAREHVVIHMDRIQALAAASASAKKEHQP